MRATRALTHHPGLAWTSRLRESLPQGWRVNVGNTDKWLVDIIDSGRPDEPLPPLAEVCQRRSLLEKFCFVLQNKFEIVKLASR